MDQSSRSPESRERALSSEPSSTRPNPFDDDEHASRKRRRTSTSLSISRSTSVETLRSQEDIIAAAGSVVMKVDTPEPALPSTPDRPQASAEPVSSKVTINIRSANSIESVPASPGSPTPAQSRSDDIKVSVEETEVVMKQAPKDDDISSSPSVLNSPDSSVIALDNVEEDIDFAAVDSQVEYLTNRKALQLNAVMLDFPYHTEEEPFGDTAARLLTFIRQQPAHATDVILALHKWLERYVVYADVELYSVMVDAYRENRTFWITLPDLFYHMSYRLFSAKNREFNDLAHQLLENIARLSSFLLAIDCRTLAQVASTEDHELDLVSPRFLKTFAHLTTKDDTYITSGYAPETVLEMPQPLDAFQSNPGGSMMKLVRFTEILTGLISRFPKRVMEYLAMSSPLVNSLVRDSYFRILYPTAFPQEVLDRASKNLGLGNRYFNVVNDALHLIIEKYINHLAPEQGFVIINMLSEILRYALHSRHPSAVQLLHSHRQGHPHLPEASTHETISLEWRFPLLCTLVRSSQMQLRVSAVEGLSSDLVALYKRHQDRQEPPDESLQAPFLSHLSGVVVLTGIIDYILGPTCHPEITQASSNILGFLAVTQTYTNTQTNLLWETLTSTQDPRISEALGRMMSGVFHLLSPDILLQFVEKLRNVPIESFTSVMRELFDHVARNLLKTYRPIPMAMYGICVRLIRESSVYSVQGSATYPDIQQFALSKFKELLSPGLTQADEQRICQGCIEDIAAASQTTSGSIQVLQILMGNGVGLQALVANHDFTRLLVNELESTVAAARATGHATVYASPTSQARRRFISSIIANHGESIDSHLGHRLWDLLVGQGAACQDDRKVAWDDLNQALKRTGLGNPFLSACLRDYLPKLPPACYCPGSLAFVREALIPLANDVNGIILDDEADVQASGVELLWQMILTAPNNTVEDHAISTLVNDIYVDGKSIVSYPLHRARRVHFALVQRCLKQLKSAAQNLKALESNTMDGDTDHELMVITSTDDRRREHELHFTRSLRVLVMLLRTLQTRSHFAAPDLRSLMLQTPSAAEGDPADLKYQSFDGDQQTEVKPLDIGVKNSAASLLASLRDVTGFENYRLYYRGQPLAPSETDICKSLQELGIKNGLILVKREAHIASSPVRIKPGASPLDIEILGHFGDLWEYLSMEEKLAREIYHFLVSLPADDSVLSAFEDPEVTHRDIFPLGQPFKTLYAIHALREYLSTRRLKSSVMQTTSQSSENRQKTVSDQENSLVRATSLIIAAICDPQIIEGCSSQEMRLLLSFHFVDNLVQLLKETMDLAATAQLLTLDLHERLVSTLAEAAAAQTSKLSVDLVHRSLEALLESCAKTHEFWGIFRRSSNVQQVIQALLLSDERPFVRKNVAKLVIAKSCYNHDTLGVLATDFAELFWPSVSQLLPRAVLDPSKCEEVFNLSFQLLKRLIEFDSPILDLASFLAECGQLLASHTAMEDVSHPEKGDIVAHGLIMILHHSMKQMQAKGRKVQFPPGFANILFLRHLFPSEDENGPLVPRALLFQSSRSMLYEIIYLLVKDDLPQLIGVLRGLDALTSFNDGPGGEIYKYELPQSFDRTNAIRSACGHSGLRNLSNTCYLNSLLTQLFMNVGFRRFILNARVSDSETSALMHETQALFAHLQDSRRRFIDPQACVSQIMTYEELPIDIHNQMDVDEFYNLLFDRWEAQLLSESDQKALKSFYGGQLVQQVKSKECEHISERIEPFSAIQCDIKGKSSLEESLQAYVDGEIMQGDNKYKCSTCDRHVDAVKRACLKDIPDNLIFHLKRFDFNLRTLQRSKINDYFPFPAKIDMQPYTIEHLSNPVNNTQPDTFELVGVLVHSGTAESGHYYSFIREQSSVNGVPSWIEFNDEAVTTWDPAQMENACFGGQDTRSQFEPGSVYEKVYSAYMLFYQRSSSAEKEREILRSLGDPSLLRSPLPLDLELQVKADNWATIQRHCLYDPTHIPFVQRLLLTAWGTECSDDHKRENLAMQVALGHLDQVASRAKELPDFDQLKNFLVNVCQRCSLCCFAFFEYFRRHKEALRMMLIKNSDASVRYEIGQSVIYALSDVRESFPDEYGIGNGCIDQVTSSGGPGTLMEAAADLFLYLWETFHTRLAAWPELFGTLTSFAGLGEPESCMLLEKDVLSKSLMIIMADPGLDLGPQINKLLGVLSRRIATRPPNYENIITLIEALLHSIDVDLDKEIYVEQAEGRFSMAMRRQPIPFTAQEVNLLHQDWDRVNANVFMDKLILVNQNPSSTDAIMARLSKYSNEMDRKIYTTLRIGITGQLVAHMVSAYLERASWYCQISTNRPRVHQLILHVNNECRNLHNTEGRAFLEFQTDIFDAKRSTGEAMEEIILQNLTNLSVWVPGLLGYLDHTVTYDVERFVHAKLFVYGPSPVFEDDAGVSDRSRTMNHAARNLAVACLLYLRDTYVTRAAQVARDTLIPFTRVIKQAEPYFKLAEETDDGLEAQYNELYPGVLEQLDRLAVDEVEEDGSDWEQSVGSSEDQIDGLADLMDRELE